MASETEPPGKKSDGVNGKSWMLQLARYSQIGFALPAMTAAGWFLGKLLDGWLHTTWLYIAGLLFGIVAGFVELSRIVTKNNQSGEGK